jgi:hypothetical protein
MFHSPSKLLMRIYLVPELMICKTSKEDDNLNNGNSKEDLLTWQVIHLFILNILKIEIFIKSFIFRTTDNKH